MTLDIITGSSGFIGQNLIKNMKNKKFIGIDKLENKKFTHIKSNIAKIDFFKIANNQNIKNIYHFGGHSNLSYLKDFHKSFNEDIKSILNILKFLDNNKNIRLIYSSSSYTYQGLHKNKVSENYKIDPRNSFGFAKILFESLIRYRHKNSIIYRIASVCGDSNVSHPNLISNMIKTAENESQINIWGKGNRKLQFIDVNLLGKIILKNKNLNPGIYNLGSSRNLKVKTIAKEISKNFNKKIKIDFNLKKNEGESLPLMSITKIKKKLNLNKLNPNQIIKNCINL